MAFVKPVTLALAFTGQWVASALPTVAASPTTQDSKQIIHLELYRHGFSCVNIIEKCAGPQIDLAKLNSYSADELVLGGTCMALALGVDDPILTDYGVNTTTMTGAQIARLNTAPHIVLASTMVRAMETAAYMFSSAKKVYQVPYIKEEFALPNFLREIVGEGPNVPLSVADQRDLLNTYDQGVANKFSWDLIPAESKGKACNASDNTADPRCISDFNKFLSWFADLLASNPPAELATNLAQRTPVTVAIVLHGDLLENQILVNGTTEPGLLSNGSVLNNMGFRATFELNDAQLQRTTLWSGVPGATGVPYNCPTAAKSSGQGYARCRTRQPGIFAVAKAKCFNKQ